MQSKQHQQLFFFVDESGDPYFYDREGQYIVGNEGCSRILIVGLIKTEHPHALRQALSTLRREIGSDNYLKDIPSLAKSLKAFHATDDCAEIRERVYKAIRPLPFKAEFVVARKNEELFSRRHHKKPHLFYDDIVSKLFENQLHKSEENVIYFAVRGNRARQAPLEEAIQKAVLVFEKKWKTRVDSEIRIYSHTPEGEPCLQVIDYLNWAVQRVFTRQDDRYFNFIREQVSPVVDLYDFGRYPKNFYNRKNPLGAKTISPL